MSVKQIMLENVKYFKKILITSILILIPVNILADEKDKIISKLNNLNSLEFTFDQLINEKNEKGSCLLEFLEN